jgi:hypothetical protein
MKRLVWLLLLPFLNGCGFQQNNGVYQITIAVYQHACVDVQYASTNSGAPAQLYPCGSGKRSQEWQAKLTDNNSGLQFINGNSKMCLSVLENPVTAPGQYVIQEPCAPGGTQQNQIWTLAQVSGTSGYNLVSAASKQCLDLPYGAIASISLLQQFTCTPNDPAQWWVLRPVSTGSIP